MLQVALDIPYFLFLFTAALLATVRNDVVVAIVRKQLVDKYVLSLMLSGMIPGYRHDIEGNLAINELPLPCR